MFRIRPFERTEVENKAVAEIQSVAWSNSMNSVAMWNRTDGVRDPRSLMQRFVAVDQGNIVGLAVLMEPELDIAQGRYGFSIAVRPDQQGKGIGSAIYKRMMTSLEGRPLQQLTTGTSEDNDDAVRFLERYGFRQVQRDPIALLDLAAFDAAPFAGIWERMARQGIQVLPLNRAALCFPDWQRRIWELDWELVQDLKSFKNPERKPFEQFQRAVLGRRQFNPASWFVALDGDQWVGICRLMDMKNEPDTLYHGLTGVVRSHRRRGIATALKISAIEYAWQSGARFVETETEEYSPIHALNLKLGYIPQPAWLTFVKEFPVAG